MFVCIYIYIYIYIYIITASLKQIINLLSKYNKTNVKIYHSNVLWYNNIIYIKLFFSNSIK